MHSTEDVPSRHVSQVIHKQPSTVYEFAADPDNLAKWASGLAEGVVTRDGDSLVVASPMGQVVVRFAGRNEWGVLDHDVTLPSGLTVNNPVRVVTHPDGAEVLFTVRQIALTDEQFARDLQTVADDLKRLRMLVEAG